MRQVIPAVAAFFLVSLSACAHHARPPVEVSLESASKLRDVALSDDIRKICQIEETERTPKFDFDSSDLSGPDRDVLAQVARCLTTGPLRGRAVQLIGRADPRGETEYNMTLGDTRAGHVDQYLVQLGVDPAQMATTSRGELDATGTDEASWQRDRRVDMRLASPATVSVLTPSE
jgi:peptidoglycan-associated lipoprotein